MRRKPLVNVIARAPSGGMVGECANKIVAWPVETTFSSAATSPAIKASCEKGSLV